MKIIGKLRKQVDNASSNDEKKKIIANAGMLLSDDELVQVSGGCGDGVSPMWDDTQCKICEEYGTVSSIGFDETGRIEYFYCANCQNTYSVYNG